MSEQPPSFKPEHARKRPDDDGARYVGRSSRRSASERMNAARHRPTSSDPAASQGTSMDRNAGTQRGRSENNDGNAHSPRGDEARQQRPARADEPRQGSAVPPSYQPARRTYPSSERDERTETPRRAGSRRAQSGGVLARGARPDRSRERSNAGHTGGPGRLAPRRPRSAASRRPRIGRTILVALLVLLAAFVVWAIYLVNYGNSKLSRVDALVDGPDSPGTSYLIVGSDAREKGGLVDDPTEGMRADTIMLLHVPTSGTTSLISLPRDSYVEIPGHGYDKLNSSIAYGGPKLLVATVQKLTGLTIDHYVQIGMDGVAELTDAVGGVNLCYDRTVDDLDSGLKWTAGCHDVGGKQALAFSRMRKSDPRGDIGRTERQRQVVSKIISKAASPATFVNPGRQRALVGSGASTLTVDTDSGLINVAQAGLALRNALGPSGVSGTPPIASLDYRAGGRSNVLLADSTPDFFKKVADGTVTSADAGGDAK